MDVLAQLRRYNVTHAPAESVDDVQIQAKAMAIVDQRKAQLQRRQHQAAESDGAAAAAEGKENSRQQQQQQKQLHPSHQHIPKFFFGKRPKKHASSAASAPPRAAPAPHVGAPTPLHDETVAERRVRLFQELAYSRALHLLEADIIQDAEARIAGVCMALAEALRGEGVNEDELALDYDHFCTFGEQCVASPAGGEGADEDEGADGSAGGPGVGGPGEAFRQYFTAAVFVQLSNPQDDKVGLGVLQDYITQHQRYLHAVLLLSRLDLERSTGDGRFTEEVVEAFVATYLEHRHHNGPVPYQLDPGFVPFYRLMVVRRFFFFLDPNRKGFVTMRALLQSTHFADFIEAQYPQDFHFMAGDREHAAEARAAAAAFAARNIFVPDSLLGFYDQFVAVDRDHNGMISEDEMANFDGQMLTPHFLVHLFQETLTFAAQVTTTVATSAAGSDGSGGGGGGSAVMEMDFRGFLDFAMAMHAPHEPASLKYYWRILDFDNRGYMDRKKLKYYLEDVLRVCEAAGLEHPLEAVVDNIWDMVLPAKPDRITLQDLVASQNGGLFVSVVSSALQFIQYDQRET